MNTQELDLNVHQKTVKTTDRKMYSRPMLAVYGDVGNLTKGSGGTKTDGTMNDKKAV